MQDAFKITTNQIASPLTHPSKATVWYARTTGEKRINKVGKSNFMNPKTEKALQIFAALVLVLLAVPL